jgi:hypothetical protein
MNLLEASMDDIDLEDERFRYSFHFDLAKLRLSIKKIGLVSPLAVVSRDKPKYVLVSGWKRALACRQLSITTIPVRIIEEQDDFRVFLLSVYENWAIRNFNILERAEILLKLRGFVGDERKIVKKYFPVLDIPKNLSYLDLYLKIGRLDHTWKKIIFDKKMPLSAIQPLTEFTPEDRELLLPHILPLNLNKLKQFCEDLYELSKKTGDSPKTLLSSPEILSVSQSDNLSSLQKADKIRSILRTLRYPNLSRWKKNFDKSVKKAMLTEDVAFDSASFFEDGEFSVTFSVFDKKAFQDRLSKLQELGADEELFSLLKSYSDG